MQDSGRVRQFINRHNIKIACCFSIVALVSNLIVMKRHKKENGLKPVEKEDVRSGMVYTKGMERFREDFIDLKNDFMSYFSEFGKR